MTAAPIAPITDEALAEVVRLAEGARRQGPWHECSAEEDEWGHRFQKVTEKATGSVVAHVYGDHAAYIAAANPATVLAMRARIAEAEAEVEAFRAEHQRLTKELMPDQQNLFYSYGWQECMTQRVEPAEGERDRARAALTNLLDAIGPAIGGLHESDAIDAARAALAGESR